MSTSFSFSTDYLKRERLERRRARFQEKLEDVKIALSAYSYKVMEYNQKIDECKNKIPLATHPPMREKLEKRYEDLNEIRDTTFAKSLECKATMDTLNYHIDQLDAEINGLEEDAILSDD